MKAIIKKDDEQYKKVLENYLKTGGAKKASGPGPIGRSGDGQVLQVGEVIYLPEEIVLLEIPIEGSTRPAYGIIVGIASSKDDNAPMRYQLWYPSALAKRTQVVEVDSDGNEISRTARKPSGTAAVAYQAKAGSLVKDILAGFVAEGHHAIEITMAELKKTPVWGKDELTDTMIYDFDFVV